MALELLDHGSESISCSPPQCFCLLPAAQFPMRKTHRSARNKTGLDSGVKGIRAQRKVLRGDVRGRRRERVPKKLEAKSSRRGSALFLERTASNVVERKGIGDQWQENSCRIKVEE